MRKVIKLSESEFRNMVTEAIREINLSTLKNASDLSGSSAIGDINDKYPAKNTVAYSIKDIEDNLNYYEQSFHMNAADKNKLYMDARNGLDAIKRFFERKYAQGKNFDNTYDKIVQKREDDDDFSLGAITSDEYKIK